MNIAEEIAKLEKENERIKEYQKLLDKALKIELGIGLKEVEKLIKNQAKNPSDFEEAIADYFDLVTENDKAQFLRVMLSSTSLDFYRKAARKAKQKEDIGLEKNYSQNDDEYEYEDSGN